MAVGPGQAVTAPPLSAPTNGLVRAAAVDERTDDRWLGGIRWDAEACAAGEIYDLCDFEDIEEESQRPGLRSAVPFVARTYDVCSSFGYQSAEYEGRARRQLMAIESALVEHEFWTGELNDENAHLAVEAAAGVNEVQTLTITATGGTYTLSFNGSETDPIDFDADDEAIQAALESLTGITVGDVVVTGSGPFTITFGGDLADTDVPLIVADDSLLTVAAGSASVTTITPGGTGVDEEQELTIDATGGTYTLTYSGQTTSALDFDADASTIEAALVALSNIGPGDVVVTGSGPFLVTFGGALAETNVDEITVDDDDLTGGSGGTAVVVESTPGEAGVTGPTILSDSAVSPLEALSLLEQALADGKCGAGMIHARPRIVTLWKASNALIERNGQLYTPTGHVVVPGTGYPGTGPEGEEVTANSEWAFATEMVRIVRSLEITTPTNEWAEVLDRTANTITIHAERPYAIQWSQCCWAAVEIDPTP